MRLNRIQAKYDSQTSKKSVNQNFKAKSDERMTKFEVRSAAAAIGRKSLPALKQDNSDKSDKFRDKYGFPVKPGVISVKPIVRKSTVPKPSTLSSRVSDDFVVYTVVVKSSTSRRLVDKSVSLGRLGASTRGRRLSRPTFVSSRRLGRLSRSAEISGGPTES
ncbi:hypothetical protein OROMI_008001 [Orobanche minor]